MAFYLSHIVAFLSGLLIGMWLAYSIIKEGIERKIKKNLT